VGERRIMDKKIERLAEILGIEPSKLEEAIFMVGSEEGGEEACGEVNKEHFYYNPDIFAKLHKIDCTGLKNLVVPNLRKLRR
jgi:hypothetical protein